MTKQEKQKTMSGLEKLISEKMDDRSNINAEINALRVTLELVNKVDIK